MKKRYAVIATAVAAVLLTSIMPSSAYAEPSSEELQKELDEKAQELEKVIEKYKEAKADLKDTEDEIEEIEDQLPELEKKAEESRKIVSNIAVNEYTSVGTRPTTLMAGSPDAALDRMTMLGAISSSQAADMKNYAKAVEALDSEESVLGDLKDEQKATKDKLGKKKDKIESEIADIEAEQAELGQPDSNGPVPPPSGDASAVIEFAYAQIGEPYAWGAAGPDSWDCSGLVMMSWQQAGVSLSHQTNSQYSETARISRDQLKPGDIVFYNDMAHDALYVGSGTIVHAPQAGQNVTTAPLDSMAIVGYGRPG